MNKSFSCISFVHMPGKAKILTAKAIFALGIYAGLRIGEIIALKTDQLFTKLVAILKAIDDLERSGIELKNGCHKLNDYNY